MLPGVQLVQPFEDTFEYIRKSDLVVSIQGTMGLEAALLGKQVIMLGNSPIKIFPSASSISTLTELPELIKRKLSAQAPSRDKIIEAYAEYLSPYLYASDNDWINRKKDDYNISISEKEINGYVKLITKLEKYLSPLS